MNIFQPQSETIISFSGGRSSAMMLKLFLDANGGQLPDHVKVLFANTGKELPETLDFVHACSVAWKIPITWLEYTTHEEPQKRWREVTYETVSRKGEPFHALIGQKNFLPNPAMRFCTIELKIRTIKLYTQQVLGWKNWDIAVGFRADEPSRVAKLSIPNKEPFERFAPLAKEGYTKSDVGQFWKFQGFDLGLINNNGTTPGGNCDLCFLKDATTTLSLIRDKPSLADWWIGEESRPLTKVQEHSHTGKFRKDRAPYIEIKAMAVNHGELFEFNDEAIADCGCTD